MNAGKITLKSPEKTKIIGVLCEDKSICSVSVTYYDEILDIQLDSNLSSPVVKINGEFIFVDENHKEWYQSSVIDKEIFGV